MFSFSDKTGTSYGLRLLRIFLPELVHAAFGVDELLLAGEKGMANRADVELYRLFR